MVRLPAEAETPSGFNSSFAKIRVSDAGDRSLVSSCAFSKDQTICKFFAGEISSEPNYLTLQTGLHQHILLEPAFLRYVNHSCDPNTFFDINRMEFVALKDIEEGEEFRFFYPSTEWIMESPFVCTCKTTKCLGSISGAKFIDRKILDTYKISDFIKQQLSADPHE